MWEFEYACSQKNDLPKIADPILNKKPCKLKSELSKSACLVCKCDLTLESLDIGIVVYQVLQKYTISYGMGLIAGLVGVISGILWILGRTCVN